MMGRLNQEQGQLFYSFCLDEVVPDDHSAREIAAVLDLSSVYAELAPHYSHLGRPSIDPVLMPITRFATSPSSGSAMRALLSPVLSEDAVAEDHA
jgi:hypothetical protein